MFVATLQGRSGSRRSLQIEKLKRYVVVTSVRPSVTWCQRLNYLTDEMLMSTQGLCCKGGGMWRRWSMLVHSKA